MPATDRSTIRRRPVAGRDGLDAELAGLDALELAPAPGPGRRRRAWSAAWPKLAAAALGLFLWQVVVWAGWKSSYVLPGPGPVFRALGDLAASGSLAEAVANTMRRGLTGFALSILIGVVLGVAVAQVRVLRTAFGSLITGLQTMPSIAWFPLAVLLFQRSEKAILFVVILGSAPSIANGLVAGVDTIPPLLLRAGRVLGARGAARLRYVVMPAALPSFVAGLKQGWSFSWRSLLAGELLVIIANKKSIGSQMEFARQFSNAEQLIGLMLVVLVIGIVIDAVVFGTVERRIRRRWGLVDPAGD
ncbi:MAG TPA: ABC transporter permease [Acidimicrobiales bacterium]